MHIYQYLKKVQFPYTDSRSHIRVYKETQHVPFNYTYIYGPLNNAPRCDNVQDIHRFSLILGRVCRLSFIGCGDC